MKGLILTAITIGSITNSYCQTPEENTIYSVYVLDSNGNSYRTKRTYDHKPTPADSLEFEKTYMFDIDFMMLENDKVSKMTLEPPILLRLKPRKKKAVKRKYTTSKVH